ncbi:MAG: sterol desaturase family protein [Robiginitomaculum sp.]|nr:sterol desaturase family protein [Robiginitomaculum sp.]
MRRIIMETLLLYITDTLPMRALMGLRFEGVRYAMGTLGVFFTIWVLLAPLLKNRRIRKPMPKKRLHGQIKMELFNSLRTICVFIALDILVFDMAEVGVFKTYRDVADYGWLWFGLSIPLAIILHDAYFYWTHRAMHHKKLYKLFHLTHHRSHNPTPFTAYSFAIGEAVVMYGFVPILMVSIPMHTGAMSIVLLAMIFKNAVGHCGYELFPKGTTKTPILRLNTTVTHHDMHHEKASGNYGFYFTYWDKWMGTEHANYEARFEAVTEKSTASKPARFGTTA